MVSEYVLVLPGESPPSWNKYYAGMHWAKRHAESQRVHDLVQWSVLEAGPVSFEQPVAITLTSYRPRPLDADNIAAKLYVDGLVRAGVLVDDTPRYVARVTTASVKAKKDETRLVIALEEVS